MTPEAEAILDAEPWETKLKRMQDGRDGIRDKDGKKVTTKGTKLVDHT